MTELAQSYVNGTSDKPLMGDTIGAHFDKAVARWHNHDALVVRHPESGAVKLLSEKVNCAGPVILRPVKFLTIC